LFDPIARAPAQKNICFYRETPGIGRLDAMFSKRTKLSLIQLLTLLQRAQLLLLLEKYDLVDNEPRWWWNDNQDASWVLRKTSELILSAAPERVSASKPSTAATRPTLG
jgi:hypothetical protein